MRTRILLVTVSLVVSLTWLVHAPASSAAETPSAQRLSFVNTANAVCRAGNGRLAARVDDYLSRRQSGGSGRRVATPDDVQRYIADVAGAEIARQLSDLTALNPPTTDEKAFREILANARRVLDRVRRNPRQSAFGDPFQPIKRSFNALGISECAKSKLAQPAASQ